MGLTTSMTAFADGTPSLDDGRALATEAPPLLLELIACLLEAKQRGHLEILGQSGLPKAAKKAARKAAHKLKCAGVTSDIESRKSVGVDFSIETDLSQIALVSAPGLRGQGWHAFAGLPGLSACEIMLREGCQIAEANVLQSLSIARLKRALIDMKDQPNTSLPVLCDASLAVRMIDHTTEAVRAGDGQFPREWTHVLSWRDKAVDLGADPESRDASTLLSKELTKLKEEPDVEASQLLMNPECGIMLPPTAVLEALFREVQVITHSDREYEREDFDEHLRGLAHAALDQWLSNEKEVSALARRMKAIADVLLYTGDKDGALHALWLSERMPEMARLPHEYKLLSEGLVKVVAFDAAWQHYKQEDHAQCGHDHDHDHG
jgi:hypothetical protein